MIENKSLIYGLVIISGFILVWLIYADQGIYTKPDLTENETPLILVDGKVKGQFAADLSFEIKATREEIQDFINKVVEDK